METAFWQLFYSVVEIKYSDEVKPEHKLQAFVYNYILGRIQNFTPEYVTIRTESTEQKIKYDEELLLSELKEITQIIKGDKIPPAIFNGVDDRWQTYCNKTAILNKDISIIQGIGIQRRKLFIAAGLDSIDKIAGSTREEIGHIKGLGEQGNAIQNSAKAISKNQVITLCYPPRFLKVSTEIYLDFEGATSLEGQRFSLPYRIFG